MCFHVFPMCEHAERVSLRAGLLGRSSASKGAHRRGWMVQLTGTGWGISVIEGGEIQKSLATVQEILEPSWELWRLGG